MKPIPMTPLSSVRTAGWLSDRLNDKVFRELGVVLLLCSPVILALIVTSFPNPKDTR